MDKKVYPNLEAMCRLCLKEDAGTVCIFNNEENPNNCVPLSIPMRIMACVSLEVQCSDVFPKKICSECRYQLEKSYYFRKLSQASDAKLRKHLRLIGMGKPSKVFDTKLEEEYYDELELQDSINFIRDQEDQQKQVEKLKIDSFINEMKLKNAQELGKIKESLRTTGLEELTLKIREELREELQTEIKNEFEENIRKEVTEQCISLAKESLRTEVREECRKLEMKCLLDDLQMYLLNKNKSLAFSAPTKVNVLKRPISTIEKNEPPPKVVFIQHNSPNIQVVRMELESDKPNVEKENVLLAENVTDDQNTNDEECDSEGNFLIYEEEDGFNVKRKSVEEKHEYDDNVMQELEYEEDDEFVEDNIETYERYNSEIIETKEESAETTSTISYQIEDNEDGEIKFLKKSNDDDINNVIDEEIPNQKYGYKNVVVINIDDGTENEYEENFEEVEKKLVKKEKKSSTKTSSHKKDKASKVTRTSSLTSETTFLTKTFVNPLQRSTDTPKIFRCEDCPMVFSTKPSLERHLRTHRKIEKTGITFQCPECRIVVSCSSALRRHMYVHCEEKPFACDVCSKAFVQKEILKRHMQTHTGIKPHQCPHCERSFAQRINLTQHINRNHLEEPQIQQHSCHLCPKRFNHASGLSRHLASHSGVAFQCSECDRTFGDRSSIKRHIATMHCNSRASKDEAKAKTQ